VGGGDLAEALASVPFPEDRDPIDVDWPATDVASFEPGPAHAGPDPLDDQIALQLGDRADDDDDGAAERTTGIEVLPEAHIFDVEVVQFIQHLEEVADGAPPGGTRRDPVAWPSCRRSGRYIRRRSRSRADEPSRGDRGVVSQGCWSRVDTRRYKATVFIASLPIEAAMACRLLDSRSQLKKIVHVRTDSAEFEDSFELVKIPQPIDLLADLD